MNKKLKRNDSIERKYIAQIIKNKTISSETPCPCSGCQFFIKKRILNMCAVQSNMFTRSMKFHGLCPDKHTHKKLSEQELQKIHDDRVNYIHEIWKSIKV